MVRKKIRNGSRSKRRRSNISGVEFWLFKKPVIQRAFGEPLHTLAEGSGLKARVAESASGPMAAQWPGRWVSPPAALWCGDGGRLAFGSKQTKHNCEESKYKTDQEGEKTTGGTTNINIHSEQWYKIGQKKMLKSSKSQMVKWSNENVRRLRLRLREQWQ